VPHALQVAQSVYQQLIVPIVFLIILRMGQTFVSRAKTSAFNAAAR